MEQGKRVEAEFQLPEAIIQHIQSFMNGKKAARTTLLSKSWYTAWLTRPSLNFDQKHFLRKSIDDDIEGCLTKFWKFVNKIRYEKLNLKIDSLRLCVYGSYGWEHALVNKLIVKALELGASDLDYRGKVRGFALPYQVFGFKNLIRLSVSGCRMEAGDGKVSCSGLKSLTLDRVYVEGDVIWDIISSCPLIENLSIDTLNMSLSEFPVLGRLNLRNVGRDVDWLHQFRNLKRMLLYGVHFHPLYFDDFFSKFPCLKDMTLYHCYGFEVIRISSPTLEYIKFTQDERLRVKFDVPNLRRITFLGESIPLLTFETATTTWESYITIVCQHSPRKAKWFLKLNKLLKNLSPSKVSLTLLSKKRLDYEAKIEGLPKPEVENLAIKGSFSVCPALFYNLFQCCRPVYITQHWSPELFDDVRSNNFMDFVYERMMRQVGLNSCIAYQRKSGQCDLEEVSVEFYDESVSAWRPRLLDTSSSIEADEEGIPLHLRWGR